MPEFWAHKPMLPKPLSKCGGILEQNCELGTTAIDPFETLGYRFKLPETGHWQRK